MARWREALFDKGRETSKEFIPDAAINLLYGYHARQLAKEKRRPKGKC